MSPSAGGGKVGGGEGMVPPYREQGCQSRKTRGAAGGTESLGVSGRQTTGATELGQ